MPIKYQCPKCGRRFVDWGAEKLGFMCPDDEGVELIRVGTGDDAPQSPRRSSAKRAPRRVTPSVVAPIEDEDIDEITPPIDADADDEAEEGEDVEADDTVEVDADAVTVVADADGDDDVVGVADDAVADDDEE